jgi:two-component system chemotaxis sensor kinase CheA
MEETDVDSIKEFLVESAESLGRLDREMVELERRPEDTKLLASIFRTFHTMKGTCGFLGYRTIERVTHHAENILSQIRDGDRPLTPRLVSLILETVDAVKTELASIAVTSTESGAAYTDLLERQQAVARLADATIRVDVGLLDRLMHLVDELALARNQVLQFTAGQGDAGLNAARQRLDWITTELQANVTKTRMQPIGAIWNKLPRVVRDLATACDKQIGLEWDGADTSLDETIIEAIQDPLIHIVRNSCDHGIETPGERLRAGKPAQGRLMLRAFYDSGNMVNVLNMANMLNVEISDDGAGVDPQGLKASAIQKGLLRPEQADRLHDRELVNLAFLPGVSTARQVSNVSGRGVGMDVVRTNVEKIGGTVAISSRWGYGTVVRIKIPLTPAILPPGTTAEETHPHSGSNGSPVMPSNCLFPQQLQDD